MEHDAILEARCKKAHNFAVDSFIEMQHILRGNEAREDKDDMDMATWAALLARTVMQMVMDDCVKVCRKVAADDTD